MRRPHCLLPVLVLGSACRPGPDEMQKRAIAALQTEVPAIQKAYHASHGRYADHIRQLTGGADTLASGVRVIIHGAGTDWWSATSSDPGVPGAACAGWIGENPRVLPSLPGNSSPSRPGEITCLAFGPLKKTGQWVKIGPFPMRP
jgi:hypothetical protein